MHDSLFAQNRGPLNTILDTVQDFGIVVGEHQSYDKMAAALALFLALQATEKNVQIISRADPKVEVSNLVGIDKVKKGFDGITRQFVIALPYREGEIEKISYNAEGPQLNINVVGGESGITFTEKDIKILKQGTNPSVIFTVGVDSEDDLTGLVDINENLKIINIDNSVTNTMYGDILYADPTFSSISEVVGRVIIDTGLLIDPDIAQNLMNGIISATSNFSAQNTTPLAFEIAAFLMRNGAVRQKIKLQDKREPIRPEFQPKPRQNQPINSRPNNMQDAQPAVVQNSQPDVFPNNQNNDQAEEIPSDWFTPKVFRGSKGQQE